MSINIDSDSHKGSFCQNYESLNIQGPEKHDVTSSRFTNSFEFWLSALGYAVGYGNIWRFPYMLYRNGGGVFFIPYLICIFVIILPLSFLEISYGQLYRHEMHRYYDSIHPRLLGLSYGLAAVIFFIAMYYMCLIAWCVTFLMYSFQNPLPWTPGAGESIHDALVSDSYFTDEFLGKSEDLFDFTGYSPIIALAFVVACTATFLIIYEGIDTAKYVVYIIVPLPYILMVVMFIKGINLEGHTIGWAYLFKPDWSKLTTLQIWVDACGQTLFSAGLGQMTIVKFASHRQEGDPILSSTITIPIMNFLTSIFAAFTLFAFVGYASKMTNIPIEEMAIGGMELTFVVYPALMTILPWPHVWSILFFIMLTTIGLCTNYIFIECVSKLIYGTCKRRNRDFDRHPTIITFLICCVIFAFNVTFFASSAGYYWVEMVDHYATGVNLVVFLFFQLIALVYLLPIEDLVNKVEKHGEDFPKIYLFSLKFVCPVFSLFLAAMAILREISFKPVSHSVLGQILSYTIFSTPSILFIIIAIWNPFQGEVDKRRSSRFKTEQLLRDDDYSQSNSD